MIRNILQIISWLALISLVIFPLTFLAGKIGSDTMKLYLVITTIVWFATAPFWMKREGNNQEA